MELDITCVSEERIASCGSMVLKRLAHEACLSHGPAGYAQSLVAEPGELLDLLQDEIKALLALQDSLADSGLALEPQIDVSPSKLLFYLDGEVSVRMLYGAPPYYLDARDLESGLLYDAYACCNPSLVDGSTNPAVVVKGLILGEDLLPVPGSAGLLYGGPLREVVQGTEMLTAIVASDNVIDDQYEIEQSDEGAISWAELQSELHTNAADLEQKWQQVLVQLGPAGLPPTGLDAAAQSVLAEFPILATRLEHELEWRNWAVSSLHRLPAVELQPEIPMLLRAVRAIRSLGKGLAASIDQAANTMLTDVIAVRQVALIPAGAARAMTLSETETRTLELIPAGADSKLEVCWELQTGNWFAFYLRTSDADEMARWSVFTVINSEQVESIELRQVEDWLACRVQSSTMRLVRSAVAEGDPTTSIEIDLELF